MSDVRARVLTEALGGSPLSRAVQSRALPAELQPWWPASHAEWNGHAERVRARASANWLEAIRPAIAASGAAAKRLERAAGGKGIVVTTGQQAGLFGGPLYTLNKALTALALADVLERQLGMPVAPVFWAATDDADFLEASVTHVADANGLVELKLSERPPAGTPMSAASLGDTATLLQQLRKASGSAAHAEYFELARVAYTARHTVGEAYVHLLRGLLEPLGISVLDSSHAAYMDASRESLLQALTRAPEIAAVASTRASALRKLGFGPQVEDDRGLSLVFVNENGVRRRLSAKDAVDFTKTDAKRAGLSPNVLLRPIVERALLPTAAYVAGPGELAYFSQVAPVAQVLGSERVVGVPRWSCTIVEPFAEKALRRLGATPLDARNIHELERRLATDALPERVARAWTALQQRLTDALRELGDATQESALVPPAVVEGLGRSVSHRLGRAERRLIAAVKGRDERVRRDLAVVSAALCPLGQRQERVLNFVPMLARNGQSLLDDMREGAFVHAASLVGVERATPVASG